MNEISNQLENSLLLWLPDGLEVNPEYLQAIYCCHQALDKLLLGEISLQDYCDILDSNSVEMDDYIDLAYDNIRNIKSW